MTNTANLEPAKLKSLDRLPFKTACRLRRR